MAAELSPARADVAVTDHRDCVFPTRLNGAITGCRPPLSKHTNTHAMHTRARAALKTRELFQTAAAKICSFLFVLKIFSCI